MKDIEAAQDFVEHIELVVAVPRNGPMLQVSVEKEPLLLKTLELCSMASSCVSI
jgi:hypothetical protein